MLALAASAAAQQSIQTVVVNYSGNSLMVVDLNTGDRTLLSSASNTGPVFNSPMYVVQDANNQLLVANRYADAVISVDPTTGNRTDFSSASRGTGTNFGDPWSLALESNGNLLVGDYSPPGNLYRVDPTTGNRIVLSSGIGYIAGICVDPDGGIVVARHAGSPAILRVNPSTGVTTTLASGGNISQPSCVIRKADGHYLVLNSNNGTLVSVNPTNGTQTVVSSASVGTGPTYAGTWGLSIANDGSIFVLSFNSNVIYRVDPATGNRTEVSSATVGSGPNFNGPLAILGAAVPNITGPSNNAPTDITLSQNALTQSAAAGVTVGTFGSVDADTGDTPTFSLVSGTGDSDNGSFSINGASLIATTPSAIAAGARSIRVKVDDGNSGTFEKAFTINVTDDLAPGAPASLALSAVSDTGASNSDRITSDNTPEISGTAEAGATVTLYDGATPLGSGVANGGNWSITASTLLDGTHTLTAKATDAANNSSVASSALSLTIDTRAPVLTAPISNTLAVSAPGTINLTADENDVTFSVNSTLPAGLALNPATGVISGTPTTLSAATSFTASATDLAGNIGTASFEITVSASAQSIQFTAPTSLSLDSPTTLDAISSSGLPVTYEVISGNATVSGNTLVITSAESDVVIRITQAGDGTYASSSIDVTISKSSIVRKNQSITFGDLRSMRANEIGMSLSASASSGLPVTFTIVSGPAMISANELTLTGAIGTVTVRADQAGNGIYGPASSITKSFEVLAAGPLVYFGKSNENRDFAACIPNGRSFGTLYGSISQGAQYFILHFEVVNGAIVQRALTLVNPTAVAALKKDYLSRETVVKSAASTYTVSGSLQNGTLTVRINELNVNLSGVIDPPSGPTAPVAGLYESPSLNSSTGGVNLIAGTQGKVYSLTVTPGQVSGGLGSVNAQGNFTTQTEKQATVTGSIDRQKTEVTGTVTYADGKAETFSGLGAATLRNDRLINLSTRAHVSNGNQGTLIAGFVVGGPQPKKVVIRAIGPGLSALGISNALPNPSLSLYNAQGAAIATNDDWSGSADETALMKSLGAFPINAGSKDAVLQQTLQPGAYTVHVTTTGTPGVAIAEIYDAAENPQSEYQRLVNISSLGPITGGEPLIGGFVVEGNMPKRVLIRGIGPALASWSVPSAASNPVLRIYDANQTLVAQNDDWQTAQKVDQAQIVATAAEIRAAESSVGAFALADGSRDAAVVVVLAPGAYTATLGSADASSGTALIEIYEVQ